jgi:bifunctional DNase/RNase
LEYLLDRREQGAGVPFLVQQVAFRISRQREGAVLVEVRVQSLGLDRTNNNPVVILQEHEGERVLPIWIGPGEASAIAMQLADWSFSRPLTHDLLVSVLGGLGGTLERVIITEVVENTYFAEMIIQRNGGVISVDARPSDSIAVALRMEAKIFAEEGLLERATVEIAEEESVSLEPQGLGEGEAPEAKSEDLKDYLRKLNPEDFGRFTP